MVDQTYISRSFERCIYFIHNEIELNNPYPTEVDEVKWQQIIEDAKILYKDLKEKLGNIETVEWTGSYTSSTSGDLLINNKTVELKYVKEPFSGGWINTTINALYDSYGFPNKYNFYMKEYDVYQALEEEIGKANVNRKNSSPVSQALAGKIMKERPEFYAEYQKIETEARQAFVYDVVEYLNANQDIREKFAVDIATKELCGSKKTPDLLCEFVHTRKKSYIITKEELFKMLGDKTIRYEKDLCQFYIGRFRCTFTWKNGIGLFNPTLKIHA